MSSKSTNFNPVSLIAKKRDGGELTQEEITSFVDAVAGKTPGAIQESQIGAMLMAIYLKGLTASETQAFTKCIVDSGLKLGPYPDDWVVVDKHSTGGVGDKVSIILVPTLVACGVKVPMISGRGLGHTGGTLDKLETGLKGFSAGLPTSKVLDGLKQIGGVISGQTAEFCPADKVLYALRDVTATVTSVPLICGSIISKKIAEQLSALTLDVKFGRGGQLPNLDDARSLAISLVTLGRQMGTPTSALLTRNDSPVGLAVGNASEIAECIDCLRLGPNARAKDVIALVAAFGGLLLTMVKKAQDWDDGKHQILEALQNGSALKCFRDMCVFQGVDADYADQLFLGKGGVKDPRQLLPRASRVEELRAPRDGIVGCIDARVIGVTLQRIGAGRLKSTDVIDGAVGLELLFPTSPVMGQAVKQGQPWARLYHNGQATKEDVRILEAALEYGTAEDANKDHLADLIVQVI